MAYILNHAYIFSTIVLTVYSQVVMRWQVSLAGSPPSAPEDKLRFVMSLLINPWILSGIVATFLAGVSWMLAMTKFQISYAYPYVSLNYILVIIAGALIFNESISFMKIIGSAVVILGIIIIAKG